MKFSIFPSRCAVCNYATLYMPMEDAPGGQVFICPNQDCVQYGRKYKVPSIEADPYIEAALLRPKRVA